MHSNLLNIQINKPYTRPNEIVLRKLRHPVILSIPEKFTTNYSDFKKPERRNPITTGFDDIFSEKLRNYGGNIERCKTVKPELTQRITNYTIFIGVIRNFVAGGEG